MSFGGAVRGRRSSSPTHHIFLLLPKFSKIFLLCFCFKKGRRIWDKNYCAALKHQKTRQKYREIAVSDVGHQAASISGSQEKKSQWYKPYDSCRAKRSTNAKNLVVSLAEVKVGSGVWGIQDGRNSWDRVPERRDLHGEKIPEICRGLPSCL